MSFAGFGPDACAWFAGLEADNSKAYFAASKDRFDAAIKAPMQALLAEMQGAFGGEAKLFRQHRDTRFSKDKSPYKTATYGGVYNTDHVMGWYAAIDAQGFFAGRGVYQLAPAELTRFRDAVAAPGGEGLAEAAAAAEAAGLTLSGAALKTAPRGYAKDHPRVDLLRRKNLIIGARIPADQVAGRAPIDHAREVWAAAAPVAAWMDAALL